MTIPFGLLLSALSLVSTVRCVAFHGPQRTVFADRVGHGFTPKPTAVAGWGFGDLMRRQGGIDPDVCGWVDDAPESAVSCRAGRTCMLYTPSGHIGMAGCCTAGNYQDCGWKTTCYGLDQLTTTCTDAACLVNTFVQRCTDATAPYCVSWTYPADAVQDYGCDTDPGSTWQTIFKDIASEGITTSLNLPYAPENAVTGWQSSSSSVSSSFSGSSTTSQPNSNNNNDNSGHHTPIGVIVGAAVGGLFVIGCVIGIVIIMCFLRRRRDRKAVNAATPQVQQQGPYMAQQPVDMSPQPQQQNYYPPPGPSPPYSQPQQYSAYTPPTNDAKLGPNAQVNPVPSGSPGLSHTGSAWTPPPAPLSASPHPDLRPVSEAWSSMGSPITPMSHTCTVEVPSDVPNPVQYQQQQPVGGVLPPQPYPQAQGYPHQPGPQVFEMGS